MAREEVRLHGLGQFSVARLCLAFSGRTFESIKGLRKNPVYRALVDEIRSEGSRTVDPPAPAAGRSEGEQDRGDSTTPSTITGAIAELAEACQRDIGALFWTRRNWKRSSPWLEMR